MILTKESVMNIISENTYLALITFNGDKLSSRTMTYSYAPGTGIFMMTHNGCQKLAEIQQKSNAHLYISKIDPDIIKSYDISITCNIEICLKSSSNYQIGVEMLGRKNPMILELLASPAKDDYTLLLCKIDEIIACSYLQSINNIPKTIIKGL